MVDDIGAGFHPLGNAFLGIGVDMTDVQTHPQFGVVHLTDDLCQHLRLFFQYIFHAYGHIFGDMGQQLLPKGDGLLREPAGKVQPRVVSAVQDHLVDAVALGGVDGLPKAECGKLARLAVNGTGEQFVEGTVKGKAGDALHFLLHGSVGFLKLLV